MQAFFDIVAGQELPPETKPAIKNYGYVLMTLENSTDKIRATPGIYTFMEHQFIVGKLGRITLYSIQHDPSNKAYR